MTRPQTYRLTWARRITRTSKTGLKWTDSRMGDATVVCLDLHDACVRGIAYAEATKARLCEVELMPNGTETP